MRGCLRVLRALFLSVLTLASAKGSPSVVISVVGLGQCALDFLGEVDAYPGVDAKAELLSSSIQGGGPVATALVTLARLGVKTAFVGRVGDDDFGVRIRQGLVSEGVDCTYLEQIPGAVSQHAWIVVERGSGHRNIFWHRGSCPPLAVREVDPELIRSCALLHLDGLQQDACVAAAEMARAADVPTVLDGGTLRPGVERLLPLVDHPVVSEGFAWVLSEERGVDVALERLLGFGAQAATVTLGERGSVTLSCDGERIEQPAFEVDVVDTTGCGDVFHGGYVYGVLHGWPLRRTLRFAAACAALKARGLGGQSAIASLTDIEAFLETQARVGPKP